MPQHALSTQNGSSLVEMLVATALGLVVLTGASPLLLHMLQQQTAAQERLEQAEALRFSSQIISQHVRGAREIMPTSNGSVLEVLMPPAAQPNWISFGCIQNSANDRLQLIYSPTTQSLSCKNASTNASQQVLIDKLWPLRFEYQCLVEKDSTHSSLASDTAATAAECRQGVAAVITTLQAPEPLTAGPTAQIRWTTVVRQAYWAHNSP